jgi:hypothetical protein
MPQLGRLGAQPLREGRSCLLGNPHSKRFSLTRRRFAHHGNPQARRLSAQRSTEQRHTVRFQVRTRWPTNGPEARDLPLLDRTRNACSRRAPDGSGRPDRSGVVGASVGQMRDPETSAEVKQAVPVEARQQPSTPSRETITEPAKLLRIASMLRIPARLREGEPLAASPDRHPRRLALGGPALGDADRSLVGRRHPLAP